MVTNLCVLDFGGPDHQVRLVSLHPGVTQQQVADSTGFELHIPSQVPTTVAPTEAQIAIIEQMDPHNLRALQIKDNPPGVAV
jgi:glutaconate CoA-transferase subunit B